MNTRSRSLFFKEACKICIGVAVGVAIAAPSYAEYYLVKRGTPDVVYVGGHTKCRPKHKVRYKYKKVCHYKKVRTYHRVRSPVIAKYYVFRPTGCGCNTDLWATSSCSSSCGNYVNNEVYYGRPGIDGYYGYDDYYGYGYRWEYPSYNADLTTGDDNTWAHPDMLINDSSYSAVTYDY